MSKNEKIKQKRKKKPTNTFLVVDETAAPKPEYAPLDHELAERSERKSNKSKENGSLFAQGCTFGSCVVAALVVFSCLLLMSAFVPILQAFLAVIASLLSFLNIFT